MGGGGLSSSSIYGSGSRFAFGGPKIYGTGAPKKFTGKLPLAHGLMPGHHLVPEEHVHRAIHAYKTLHGLHSMHEHPAMLNGIHAAHLLQEHVNALGPDGHAHGGFLSYLPALIGAAAPLLGEAVKGIFGGIGHKGGQALASAVTGSGLRIGLPMIVHHGGQRHFHVHGGAFYSLIKGALGHLGSIFKSAPVRKFGEHASKALKEAFMHMIGSSIDSLMNRAVGNPAPEARDLQMPARPTAPKIALDVGPPIRPTNRQPEALPNPMAQDDEMRDLENEENEARERAHERTPMPLRAPVYRKRPAMPKKRSAVSKRGRGMSRKYVINPREAPQDLFEEPAGPRGYGMAHLTHGRVLKAHHSRPSHHY